MRPLPEILNQGKKLPPSPKDRKKKLGEGLSYREKEKREVRGEGRLTGGGKS